MVETKDGDDRPSSSRRRQLREADADSGSIPTVSNFFPLNRYYEASDKVLQSFQTAFEQKRLDEAYVYGMRYCTFCVEGIVKHDYYSSSTFAARKSQTSQRVQAVLTKLERVADWMDVEEGEREAQRKAILKKQQEERLRKQRALEQKRLADLEKRIAAQKHTCGGMGATERVEESALAKLQRLNQPLAPPLSTQPPAPPRRVSFGEDPDRPEPQEPDGLSFSTANGSGDALPPALLPPPLRDEDDGKNGAQLANRPPSYHQVLGQSSYFGPGEVKHEHKTPASTAPSYDAIIQNNQRARLKAKSPSKRLSIRQSIAQIARVHRDFQQKRMIQVSALKTYQGRTSGSTNGCTVISACVVSRHLQTHGGITDAQVRGVIDSDCVPLLRAIRSKLGLGGASLIIPSDVHDHMVDHKLLFQHKFVGAAGGNILDPKHFGELYKMLEGEPGKTQHYKAGATLFYREHVISIVKFPTSPTEAIYDMVDSLPTCNGQASRTRCMGLEALKAQLEWYTSSKLSDTNITYIERNRWDDAMADFDPRVFQAFAWADLPKPRN